jgi:hypothetical protein
MSHSRSCLGQTGPASLQAAAALSRMKMSSRSKHLSKQVFSAKQSAMGIGPRLQESETQAQRRNHVIPADGAALCNAVGLHFHDTKPQRTRRCAGWPAASRPLHRSDVSVGAKPPIGTPNPLAKTCRHCRHSVPRSIARSCVRRSHCANSRVANSASPKRTSGIGKTVMMPGLPSAHGSAFLWAEAVPAAHEPTKKPAMDPLDKEADDPSTARAGAT